MSGHAYVHVTIESSSTRALPVHMHTDHDDARTTVRLVVTCTQAVRCPGAQLPPLSVRVPHWAGSMPSRKACIKKTFSRGYDTTIVTSTKTSSVSQVSVHMPREREPCAANVAAWTPRAVFDAMA